MNPDDPRLTAHALGEADGPLSPEERAEVEALRATAEALRAGFAALPQPALDPAHRGAIEAEIRGLQPPVPIERGARSYAGLGALAATLLLVIGFAIAGATGGVKIGAQRPPAFTFTPAEGMPAAPGKSVTASHFILQGGNGTLGDLLVVDMDLDGRALGLTAPTNRKITVNYGGRLLLPARAGNFDGLDGVGYITAGLEDSPSTESSAPFVENAWIRPLGEAALSTFSLDVDTAGYAIVRRCLVEQGRLPPEGVLRLEEMVNYFPYGYDPPSGSDPFAVRVDAASCPWEPRHRLVRIALKAREVEEAARPAANLVFLLDVSGSMEQPNKLPLVKQSIALLAERLTGRDRVAIVVYAGNSGLVLPPTPGSDHDAIQGALERLSAGGSTNGGAGIELAYKLAAENFVPGGINRVILATDGDFNVGVTDPSALVKLIEEKAKSGVFLTALGYGTDNLKDSTLEQLADRGNGNYGYIDTLAEARKVLVEQGMSTLHCLGKDVKLQVEFNPARVAGYRLLGYEKRMLAAQDFADDAKDGGEVGAGHTVTAFYEVVPAGVEVPGAPVDELRYQRPGNFTGAGETLVVKLRWKEPEGQVSTPREFPFTDGGDSFDRASDDFRFAASVAAFSMVLRDSKFAGSAKLPMVREIAAGALGPDESGRRAEFLTLVDRAAGLKK
jgi:Ca-activated chloride channel family protein